MSTLSEEKRFAQALARARNAGPAAGIGRLGEKTLHAALKYFLEPDETRHEQKLGRYVADAVTENGVIEIQTRNFNTLRKKLAEFLEYAPVTVVFPAPRHKWIAWIDPANGEITKKRKSPKTGCGREIFRELYKIKPFLKHENFRLKIILFDLVEYRVLDGWSKDRKKGSSRAERIPEKLVQTIQISTPEDYKKLLPELPDVFTSADLAKAAKLSAGASGTMLNILNYTGTVERVGKKKNAYLYALCRQPEKQPEISVFR